MINPKILNEWAPYSLHQRAILIEQKFGVKVSYNAVAEVYKNHKVTYCQPQYAYCRKMEKQKEIG
jgi:transposase